MKTKRSTTCAECGSQHMGNIPASVPNLGTVCEECSDDAVSRGRAEQPDDGLAYGNGEWFRVNSGRPESV